MSQLTGDWLERAYAELDGLPGALFPLVVSHPIGDVRTRSRGVLAWRAALLAGRVPAAGEAPWPGEHLHRPLTAAVQALGVLPFTPGEPELVDLVLADLLEIVAQADARRQAAIDAQLKALREKTRRTWEEEAAPPGGGGGPSIEVDASRTGEARGGGEDDGTGGWVGRQESGEAPGEVELPEHEAERLAAEAMRLAEEETLTEISERLDTRWGEQIRQWRRLADVLGDLKTALALGFDLANRVLRHTGWTEVARLQRLVEDLPQLQAIIRELGRMNAPRGADRATLVQEVVDPVRRVVEEIRQVRSPRAPTEARGLERSDDVSRMLPSEAMLLNRPVLRRLWHARRLERALSVYRYEGDVEERVRVQAEAAPLERSSREIPERGPIVVCLDTSGSMQGAPEQIAKALVLAVAKAAHQEGRPCRVILFAGPGDVETLTVDLGPGGIGGLLRLLAMSFHGGTDLGWPLRVALETLDEAGWSRADLLLVTDGAFDLPSGALEQVSWARETHGTRVHGLLIGVQPSPSLQALCDPVHLLTDWGGML